MASDHMLPHTSSRNCAALEPLWTRSDATVPASGRSPSSVRSVLSYCRNSEHCHRRVRSLESSAPVATADACCFLASLDRTHPVAIRTASDHLCEARFFVILCLAWFLSSCLDFAWYLGSSLVLLESCLWCWSWDHHVAFVQVTSCTLLNYKSITCKFISPIWLCWSPNTKI